MRSARGDAVLSVARYGSSGPARTARPGSASNRPACAASIDTDEKAADRGDPVGGRRSSHHYSGRLAVLRAAHHGQNAIGGRFQPITGAPAPFLGL
jgi:hypothetical protein